MALIKCGDCGREFSDQAVACPQCGRPNRVWWNVLGDPRTSVIVGIVAGIAMLLIAVLICASKL